MRRDGVSLIQEKLCRSMVVCHSRDTVAKSAKLQPSCSKTSKTIKRISGGKQCQDIMLAVISDISVIIVNADREKGGYMNCV